MGAFLSNLLSGVLATVIGGVILSLAFFWWSDNMHQVPDLNGRWRFELTTSDTAYSKYEGLRVYYEALLRQEGLLVRGSGEIVFEDFECEPDEPSRSYAGAERRVVEIKGYIENNFWKRDSLVLHYWEEGGQRRSSTVHRLERFDDNHMAGRFASTAAKASGCAVWDRLAFDELPVPCPATRCAETRPPRE